MAQSANAGRTGRSHHRAFLVANAHDGNPQPQAKKSRPGPKKDPGKEKSSPLTKKTGTPFGMPVFSVVHMPWQSGRISRQ